MKLSYVMKPAPLPVGVVACWTIHAKDQFETQIGTRLERRSDGWLMVFKDGKSVAVDTERDASVLVQGIMLGRCLC